MTDPKEATPPVQHGLGDPYYQPAGQRLHHGSCMPEPPPSSEREHSVETAREAAERLCSDCPPIGYPTDATRCSPCPRRLASPAPKEELHG